MSNKTQRKREMRLLRQRTPGASIVRNGVVLQKGIVDMAKYTPGNRTNVSPRYDGYSEEEMLRAVGIANAVAKANARLEPKRHQRSRQLPLTLPPQGAGSTPSTVRLAKPVTTATSASTNVGVRPSMPRITGFRPTLPHTLDEKTIISEAELMIGIAEAIAANRSQITADQLAQLLSGH